MESSTGTQAGAHRLRPLNAPAPVQLRAPSDAPWEVQIRGQWRRIERVEDVWRVDDDWWREPPLARTYLRVALEGGHVVTVFRDDVQGSWWAQRY